MISHSSAHGVEIVLAKICQRGRLLGFLTCVGCILLNV